MRGSICFIVNPRTIDATCIVPSTFFDFLHSFSRLAQIGRFRGFKSVDPALLVRGDLGGF